MDRQGEEETQEKRRSLERWTDKWSFILHNDRDLSEAGADLALKQLDEIVSQRLDRE